MVSGLWGLGRGRWAGRKLLLRLEFGKASARSHRGRDVRGRQGVDGSEDLGMGVAGGGSPCRLRVPKP